MVGHAGPMHLSAVLDSYPTQREPKKARRSINEEAIANSQQEEKSRPTVAPNPTVRSVSSNLSTRNTHKNSQESPRINKEIDISTRRVKYIPPQE
ncbi:hypothetical protein ACLOJK_033150 [Asimina triloba]